MCLRTVRRAPPGAPRPLSIPESRKPGPWRDSTPTPPHMRGSWPWMADGELILVAAALLAAGIAASLVASRIQLPGLLLFLALGMAIGSGGLGWIAFDNYELARTIGVVALALILFEGGLSAG